ncbi:MAG: tetratricopeptide repeat protein [Rickettsiaceae bacterium]|nr:tetratricopeptide repeat protein [Rickettsiaceae bacterium]
MKKFLVLYIFVLFLLLNIAYAQKDLNKVQLQTPVHQTLVKDAYDLLLLQHSEIQNTIINNYVGTNQTGGPWTEKKIVTGAYREDLEEIVYNYNFSIFTETLTHFWQADPEDGGGDLSTITIDEIENAYQKARVYIYGIDAWGNDRIFINQFLNSNIPGWYLTYDNIFSFFLTGKYYVNGYYDLSSHFVNTKLGPYYMSESSRNTYVWEILGRAAHLLGDMGVPAHAHNDLHIEADGYEDGYMGNSIAQTYNENMALSDGGLLKVNNKNDPLRYLFYTVNQIADFFDSDGAAFGSADYGDNDYNPNYSGDYYSELNSTMQSLGQPNRYNDYPKVARSSYIMSMRAIAGLLYWFAGETGLIFETHGILSYNNTWKNITLTDNVTVPQGIKLKIISTGNVNLNGHSVTSTGGTITVEDGATGNFVMLKTGSVIKGLYTPQVAINASISGQTIEFLPNTTYNENISIINKSSRTISGGLSIINGTVTLNNADYSSINNVKIKNKITITNSDNVYLNIRSEHPNCYVEAVNSDIYFYDPYFFQTQAKAFYGHDNGHSEFFKGSFKYKTSQGVYLNFWSTADFTESIFCSNIFDINATGMCYAWINNYGYFSSSQYRSTVTSTVSVSPYQWYYCGSTAMAKTSTNSVGDVNNTYSINEDSDKSEYEAAMNDYRTIKTLLRDDREKEISQDPNKYKTDYNRTIDAFKNVVEKYPSSNEAILSLDRIGACYRALGEYENLSNYNSSMAKNNTLRPHALNIEKHSLVKQGKYKEAIELSDQIISEFPKHDLAVELLYSKGLIYNYYLNDTEKAAEMFKEVIAKYPNEMTAESAREALDNLGKTFDEREQILADEKTNFAVENYPNPFNPSTTISYSLPSDANVKVVIYDIMGRIIKTLTSETQTSGNHQVVWDGTNLNGARVSSGIYLYRFEATSLKDNNHFEKSNKLMLLK